MSKISAFPPAVTFLAADVLAGLAGGADHKITRDVLLKAIGADAISIIATQSEILVDASIIQIQTGLGVGIQIASPSDGTLAFNGGGAFQLTLTAGTTLNISANNATIAIDAGGNLFLSVPPGITAIGITYKPAFPGDWVVPPVDIWAALDRIARVVSNLGAIPIP